MQEYKKSNLNIYPALETEEFNLLKKRIERIGFDKNCPIVLFEGEVLDGWHRYSICKELNIEPVYKVFEGTISEALNEQKELNEARRHMTPEALYKIFTETTGLQERIAEENRKKKATAAAENWVKRKELKEDSVATTLSSNKKQNNSNRTVNITAKQVGLSINKARAINEMKIKDPEAYKLVGPRDGIDPLEWKKDQKKKTHAQKIEVEVQKLETVNKEIKDKFDVVVIDPPWNYNTQYDPDQKSPMQTTPSYPVMSQDELKALEIPAKDNCVLFLWTTHKFLKDALELTEIWGFKYNNLLTWNKDKLLLGKKFRFQTEFCIVAFKGNPLWNYENSKLVSDIITEKSREHSRKPERFYEIVEKVTYGTKFEMFCREQRPSWGAWGSDTKYFNTLEDVFEEDNTEEVIITSAPATKNIIEDDDDFDLDIDFSSLQQKLTETKILASKKEAKKAADIAKKLEL